MKKIHLPLLIVVLLVGGYFLGSSRAVQLNHQSHQHVEDASHEQFERGSNGGKLFRKGDFAVEVTIFETGVPPQFRVYVYQENKPVDLSQVKLEIKLTRLDGEVNLFKFTPRDNVLIGDGVVTEPHSFDVDINAQYKNQNYAWNFQSYEGRTTISETAASEVGLQTEKAKPGTIKQYIKVTGRIVLDKNKTTTVRARFPGIVKNVAVNWGEQVKKGQVLATVEGNDSLKSYQIVAPMSGTILERNTNVGDVAGDKAMFTIADLSTVWAELHIFPNDVLSVHQGSKVIIRMLEQFAHVDSSIKLLFPAADPSSQTVLAIVPIENEDNQWRPGMTIEGKILVDEKQAPLVVRKSGLQNFRDFTVVYAKVGNTYEVRMLELGLEDEDWVEVLDGLKPNTEYVSKNSFLVKADIEKSGASHDH